MQRALLPDRRWQGHAGDELWPRALLLGLQQPSGGMAAEPGAVRGHHAWPAVRRFSARHPMQPVTGVI